MPTLLEPLTLRDLTAPHRIWLAPMCQYSCEAQDGVPTDWHLVHLGARAAGGFGLIVTEAAAVVPEGRISPQDVGLWNDEQTDVWRHVVDLVHGQDVPIAVQLAHAGRKASTWAPFAEGSGSVAESDGGWVTVAPTDRAYEGFAAPRRMTTEEVRAVAGDFAAATRRAHEAGFDAVEIHAAHGYLLHQFLSPLVNDRDDEYGGSFENRVRVVLEVVDAVRAALPEDKPVFIRFSATDWADGGWDVEQTTRLAGLVADRGVDLVDVSSAGAVPEQRITVGPGYQVPFAARVREEVDVAVSAVGLITEPDQAAKIVDSGHADVVMLARAALREPSWPQRAAHELGEPDAVRVPPQYLRGVWR